MKPVLAQRKLPEPPESLEKPERQLWRRITETYDFNSDNAALSLLATAMDAHARARRCREAINRDGEVTQDRFGQLRQHPLLPAERGAQSVFVAAWQLLTGVVSLGS